MTDTLTDLEGAILGLLLQLGSATAYTIRTSFQQSPSEFWSGSAGAIYPAIARLEGRGMLTAQVEFQGKRKSRRLALTSPGREALLEWSQNSMAACGAGFDPFRLRARVWAALSESDRASLFRQLSATVQARLDAPPPAGLTAGDPAYDIEMGQQRARLDWLRRQS